MQFEQQPEDDDHDHSPLMMTINSMPPHIIYIRIYELKSMGSDKCDRTLERRGGCGEDIMLVQGRSKFKILVKKSVSSRGRTKIVCPLGCLNAQLPGQVIRGNISSALPQPDCPSSKASA